MTQTTQQPISATVATRRRRLLLSSVVAKFVMAATGLALIGFLIAHMAGNLTVFGGREAFDTYAEKLHALPGFPLVEVGLLLIFLIHLPLAIYLWRRNHRARPEKYAVQAGRGQYTLASRSMLVTGLVVAAFIVFHVVHLRIGYTYRLFGLTEETRLSNFVFDSLAHPLVALVYATGIVFVGVHVSHAFWSACHSLGLNTPRSHDKLFKASRIFGVVVALGFLVVLAMAFVG